jgi:formylglycine-generating enzyme required for sulfatase activity
MKDSTNPVKGKDKKNGGRNISFDHVIRGGGWIYDLDGLRVSFRYYNPPAYLDNVIGFRLVKNKGKS